MRKAGFIPLRYSHAFRTKFTPPIGRKPISPSLFPFSLKRIETVPTCDPARPVAMP